ncbi:hypothetical protein ACFX1R_014140 [Malus domestica]
MLTTEVDNQMEENSNSDSKLMKRRSDNNGDLVQENGGSDVADTHDQLVQTVMELKLQNKIMKSQFKVFWDSQSSEPSEKEDGESEEVKQLRQMIESLNVELLEEKQTRAAAEVALKHLQESHSEADSIWSLTPHGSAVVDSNQPTSHF